MDTKVYNLEEKKQETPRNESLPFRPIRVNLTFAEFKEKYKTISLEDAYAALGRPPKFIDKNLTTEEPCLETELNLHQKCTQK
jgi:hypothetical protein